MRKRKCLLDGLCQLPKRVRSVPSVVPVARLHRRRRSPRAAPEKRLRTEFAPPKRAGRVLLVCQSRRVKSTSKAEPARPNFDARGGGCLPRPVRLCPSVAVMTSIAASFRGIPSDRRLRPGIPRGYRYTAVALRRPLLLLAPRSPFASSRGEVCNNGWQRWTGAVNGGLVTVKTTVRRGQGHGRGLDPPRRERSPVLCRVSPSDEAGGGRTEGQGGKDDDDTARDLQWKGDDEAGTTSDEADRRGTAGESASGELADSGADEDAPPVEPKSRPKGTTKRRSGSQVIVQRPQELQSVPSAVSSGDGTGVEEKIYVDQEELDAGGVDSKAKVVKVERSEVAKATGEDKDVMFAFDMGSGDSQDEGNPQPDPPTEDAGTDEKSKRVLEYRLTEVPADEARESAETDEPVKPVKFPKGMARGMRKPKSSGENVGVPPSERVPLALKEEATPDLAEVVEGEKESSDSLSEVEGKARSPSSRDDDGGQTSAVETKAKAKVEAESDDISIGSGIPPSERVPDRQMQPKAEFKDVPSGAASKSSANTGGGDGGDGGDGGGGGGGGGGGDGRGDGDDEEEEEEDDDLFDPKVVKTSTAVAAVRSTVTSAELAVDKTVKKLIRLWATRDPSMTGQLFFFTVLGLGFIFGANWLGPDDNHEFGRDNLMSTAFGSTPDWIFNRDQGPVQTTLLTCASACVAAIAKIRLGANMRPLPPFMHGVLGLPVGFMLVFRWNNAYDRWWSGRTELGILLMHCKNLGGEFVTWVAPTDIALATRALALICALKECVADRLNGTVLKDGTVMLNATSLSTPLHPEDLEGLFAAENKVLYCLETLRECLFKAWHLGCLPPPVLGMMQNEDLWGIIKAYGECEKVVNQPPPGCIITHLKSTLMVYVCSLPFIIVHEVGVMAVVPVTALLSLALFGTEAAAEQIEQPFGNRPYHLPVRGLIINNTRDLGQTSRPVLGFSGYVNSPREFTPDYIPSLEAPAEKGTGKSAAASSGPLLWGAADAWEKSAADAATEKAGSGDDDKGSGEEPASGDKGATGQSSGDRGSGESAGEGDGDVIMLRGQPREDAVGVGVMEMGVSNNGPGNRQDRQDEWSASTLGMFVEPSKTSTSTSSKSNSTEGAAAGLAQGLATAIKGEMPLNPSAQPWFPTSAPAKSTGVPKRMPQWKVQSPIEVFNDNEIDVTTGGLKSPEKKKHMYHVGDRKRRKSYDNSMAAEAAMTFGKEKTMPAAAPWNPLPKVTSARSPLDLSIGGGPSGFEGGVDSSGTKTPPGSPGRRVGGGITGFGVGVGNTEAGVGAAATSSFYGSGAGTSLFPSPLGIAPVVVQMPTSPGRLRRSNSDASMFRQDTATVTESASLIAPQPVRPQARVSMPADQLQTLHGGETNGETNLSGGGTSNGPSVSGRSSASSRSAVVLPPARSSSPGIGGAFPGSPGAGKKVSVDFDDDDHPDSVRTWSATSGGLSGLYSSSQATASSASKSTSAAAAAAAATSRPSSPLTRSQSMGGFNIIDEDDDEDVYGLMSPSRSRPSRASFDKGRSQGRGSMDDLSIATRPAIWDVFGGVEKANGGGEGSVSAGVGMNSAARSNGTSTNGSPTTESAAGRTARKSKSRKRKSSNLSKSSSRQQYLQDESDGPKGI